MQPPDHDKSATASIPLRRRASLTARDAIICIGLCTLLLVLFEGHSIRRAGEEMRPGWERSLVLAAGRPAAELTDGLGLAGVKNIVGWVHPGQTLSGPGGFDQASVSVAAGGVPPVTPDAFDPRALGQQPGRRAPLRTVLVTGDSMAQPLDAKIARACSRRTTA